MPNVSGALGALDAVVGPLTMTGAVPGEFNKIDVSLYGNLVGTVELQRSFDGGSNWGKVSEYTADSEDVRDAIERGMQFQLKVTVYTSGSSTGRLGYGESD